LLNEVATGLGFDLEQTPLPDLAMALERYRLCIDSVAPKPLSILIEAYDQLLFRRGVVDYPAMMTLPLRLFVARPDALQLYQDAYRCVLCDEFQDVCASQYVLLRRLTDRHRNLIVVGDPCQTLYDWRGADLRFLIGFTRDVPEARLIRLNQNFRSTARIVDLANALGASLPYSRPLWTSNPPGESAQVHVAADERAEAEFVAAEIERLAAERCLSHLGEAAVLYRTNEQAHQLTLALRRRGLPYQTRGNSDLFSRREVRDVIAYLRLANDPLDSAALARIVNVPPRRLARMATRLRVQPAPLWDLPALARDFGSAAASSAEALVARIADLHTLRSSMSPAALLEEVLARTGYREWLSGQPDGPERLSRLATLQTMARTTQGDLSGWLAELQLDADLVPTGNGQRVLLSTIHGAKGGEWRVVFVVGVEEGLLPHTRSLSAGSDENTNIEEELRIAYVAVTRPRERLYLACCRTRGSGERRKSRRPSRFLRQVPSGLLAWVA
jgi:DNA helicase-2/ATP-dependent DNA helicase PcrA